MKFVQRIGLAAALALFVALPASASLPIPQSATTTVAIGPFVDSTDGSTLETGLTINASDVILSKNGGTGAAKNTGACAANSGMPGYYNCTFNATDSNTAGTLQVSIAVAGALPVYQEFTVGPVAVNTTQWGGTAVASATVNANATQISGDATAADNLETAFDGTCGPVQPFGILRQCTAASAAAGTITLDASATFGDNTLAGATVIACGSTQGYCQTGSIASNVGSTDVATLAANWAVTPSGTVTYTIFGTSAATGGGGGATAAEVWAYSGGRTVTGVSGNVTGSVASVTGNVGGNVTGSVGSVTGAVGSVTGNVGGTVNGLTTTAQANVRTAVGLATANMDTQFTGVPAAVWANGTRLLTAGTNIVLAKGAGITGFNDPTLAAIGDQVWDEVLSGHTTPGTTGAALSAAGTGGLDPTELRAALGMSSANMDTQLSTINSNVTTLNGSMNWNPAWDAEVQSEVTDALNALTLTEPSGKPAWGGTPWQWLAWIGAWTRNEIQQTSSQKILRNDAGNADIAACNVTDNGTTLTVAECSP